MEAKDETELVHIDKPNAIDKIRFDRYLATNINSFNQFGNDGQLMFSIVVYIAISYQDKDLFGYGSFDITDFGKKMNYDKGNLFRKHPNPSYLVKFPKGEKKFYTTYLGNAFYRLYTENLIFDSERKNIAGVEEFEDKTLRMLNLLKVNYDYKKREKAELIYSIDKNFEISLSKAFTLINKTVLPTLRKPNLDYLYVFLCQLKDVAVYKGSTTVTPSFEKLCGLCSINSTEASQAKKYLKKKLERLNRESDLDFDVVFYKKNGRWEYGVQIIFGSIKVDTGARNEILKDAFRNVYERNLLTLWEDKYESVNKSRFENWLKNNKKDREVKVNVFVSSYNSIFKNKIDKFSSIVKDRFPR